MKASTHKRIVTAIFAVIVIFGILLIISAFSANDTSSFDFRLPSGRQTLALVRIDGIIYDVDRHVEVLREHLENDNIAGVILRVNSPGGTVASSQELYHVVKSYKDAGKPLVVSMGNIAASGGYYIAAPAQKIFASPGTLTGSIGVIASFPIYEELAKKIGYNVRIIKSGEFKSAGSPFHPFTPSETKYFQEMIDDTYEQFLTDVATGRNMEIDSVKQFADGRAFTGRQALEYNLIDTLGGYADALKYLHEITGVSLSEKPIEIKERMRFSDWLFYSAQKLIPGAETLSRPAGLYYLFVP